MREVIQYRGLNMYIFNEKDHFISHNLRHGNGWELEQIEFIIDHIDSTKAMIDVGGDIGTYTIPLCNHFKTVYCFEPNVEHYGMIVDSLKLNYINNAIVKNQACSFLSGRCTMSSHHLNQISEIDDGEIEMVVLDDVVDDEIGFIKIDVEGHEHSVLLGCENIIDKYSPLIYLETHPSIVYDSKIRCEELLTLKGYSVLKKFTELDKVWAKL